MSGEKLSDVDERLFEAVSRNNVIQVAVCLNDGADVLARCDISTVLHEAVGGENEYIAKLVLDEIKKKVSDASQYINTTRDYCGYTPLMWAAIYGRLNAAQMLLDCGIDTEVKDRQHGRTALHHAVHSGHKEIEELLIAKGANVNAKDMDGKKPRDMVSNTWDVSSTIRVAADATQFVVLGACRLVGALIATIHEPERILPPWMRIFVDRRRRQNNY